MYDRDEIKRIRLFGIIASSVLFRDSVFRLMCHEEAAGEEPRKVHNHIMFHGYFVSVAKGFRNAYPI